MVIVTKTLVLLQCLGLITRSDPISTILIPVVGSSSLLRDVGVVHSPGVEPLELSVLIVGVQFVVVFLFAPVHISGLTGQPAMLNNIF